MPKCLGWLGMWVALANTYKFVWESFSTKGNQNEKACGIPKWTFLHKIHKTALVTYCVNLVRYFPDRTRWSGASDMPMTKDQRANIAGNGDRKGLKKQLCNMGTPSSKNSI